MITSFVGALTASLLTCLWLEKHSHRLGLMDAPGERKLQVQPVPRSGGMVIFLAYALASLVGQLPHPPLLFLLGAAVIYLGGLYDDLVPFNSVRVKVLFQVAAATLATVGLASTWSLPLVAILLGWCFLFLMVNSFNLMDNMNGVTAGMAAVIFTGLAVLDMMPGPLTVLLLGAIAGFLLRNFPRGKIFLGDQGSQLLGYLATGHALLALAPHLATGPEQDPHGWKLGIGLLSCFFLPFVADTLLVIVIRYRAGRPIMKGDQSHLAHQCVRAGLSTVTAPLLLVGLHALIVAIFYGLWASNWRG